MGSARTAASAAARRGAGHGQHPFDECASMRPHVCAPAAATESPAFRKNGRVINLHQGREAAHSDCAAHTTRPCTSRCNISCHAHPPTTTCLKSETRSSKSYAQAPRASAAHCPLHTPTTTAGCTARCASELTTLPAALTAVQATAKTLATAQVFCPTPWEDWHGGARRSTLHTRARRARLCPCTQHTTHSTAACAVCCCHMPLCAVRQDHVA